MTLNPPPNPNNALPLSSSSPPAAMGSMRGGSTNDKSLSLSFPFISKPEFLSTNDKSPSPSTARSVKLPCDKEPSWFSCVLRIVWNNDDDDDAGPLCVFLLLGVTGDDSNLSAASEVSSNGEREESPAERASGGADIKSEGCNNGLLLLASLIGRPKAPKPGGGANPGGGRMVNDSADGVANERSSCCGEDSLGSNVERDDPETRDETDLCDDGEGDSK